MVAQPNTMQIASADEVAARLAWPSRREAGGWRTRGLCHGSADKPDSASLIFRDSEGASLHVHCFKCAPRTGAERDRIRHALQAATGLQLCRCQECWQAWRAGQTPPGGRGNTPTPTRENSRQNATGPRGRDTSAYAGRLWAAAVPSTTGPRADHPVARWLQDRGVWPAGQPLPAAVRWLSRGQLPAPRPGTAAGALVMAMRRLDDSAADPPPKVQLVAITGDGRKAYHWGGKRGDKRTWGNRAPDATGAVGILTHWPGPVDGCDLHVVEGLADGLAVLAGLPYEERTGSQAAAWRYARAGYVAVAVMAGQHYRGIEPARFASVTLWPDGDDPDAWETAREIAQQWHDRGLRNIGIERLPDGCDPADIARGKA